MGVITKFGLTSVSPEFETSSSIFFARDAGWIPTESSGGPKGVHPIFMGTKMKGLLKGLRYISNKFDGKEQEMQIGYPTDVKHVAHIGWDGPSLNSPSWMNEFRAATASAPLSSSATGDRNEIVVSPKCSSQDLILNGGARDLPVAPLPRPSRRNPNSSSVSSEDSPNRDPSSGVPRHSSRHRSGSSDLPAREASEGSRRSRRERNSNNGSGGSDSSTQQDLPAIPKQSRRRKTKGSPSSGESSRSSRSKTLASLSEQGSDERSVEQQLQRPPLKPMREEEEQQQEEG